MRLLASTLLSLALAAGCSTESDTTYRVAKTGSPQSRTQAEQAHAQQVQRLPNVGHLDKPLKSISTPFPNYPESFRRANIVGTVRIRFVIEGDGTVSNPTVLGSPPAELAAITLNAIMRWRFEPPMQNGVPTKVQAEQAFAFDVQ